MIAWLLVGLAATFQSQAPGIKTTLDTGVVTLGDRLRLAVAVTHANSERVRWPDSLDLKPFEQMKPPRFGQQGTTPARSADNRRSDGKCPLEGMRDAG